MTKKEAKGIKMFKPGCVTSFWRKQLINLGQQNIFRLLFETGLLLYGLTSICGSLFLPN